MTRTHRWLLLAVVPFALASAGCQKKVVAVGTPAPSDPMMMTPFIMPGQYQPPTVPAEVAELDDDEEVIGISVNGRHRAYRLRAMASITCHVINDLFDDTPVSVTYCDQNECVRAFTGDPDGDSLPIMLGGRARRMVLRVGNSFYFQDDVEPFNHKRMPPFPYPNYPYERTTWKKWRDAHPDTDVFVASNYNPLMAGRTEEGGE
jgi:Protein of unknown function (DUF3179)